MNTYQMRLNKALVEQHRQWFDYDTKTIKPEFAEHIACPVCGSNDVSLYMEKDYFKFNRCNVCTMVYLSPRLNVPATYAFYNGEWTSIYNEQKFLGEAKARARDDRINKENVNLITSHIGTGTQKLLEIGFGGGYFLRTAQAAGYDVRGIDVDTSNVARMKPDFGDRVQNIDLYDAKFSDGQFDVVYMRDVFEHVPNPAPMLKEINRISRDGGLLYIEVPNIEGLIYSAVGERHVVIFGFAHLNYWAPKSLATIIERAGYEVVEMVHESMDFTIVDILNYYRNPRITAVYPNKINKVQWFIMSAIYAVFRIPPIAALDRAIMPKLANWLKRGSVLKLVARKKPAAS
jgi:2-polyprenyl-3-methyl-5-hydroxy-6-metoxy-1,4-benzoquinol methylase